MATCSECGIEIVKLILNAIDNKHVQMPTEFPLNYLQSQTGYTAQLIGSSFDYYINKPLLLKGISSRKCGKPMRIQISKITTN